MRAIQELQPDLLALAREESNPPDIRSRSQALATVAAGALVAQPEPERFAAIIERLDRRLAELRAWLDAERRAGAAHPAGAEGAPGTAAT